MKYSNLSLTEAVQSLIGKSQVESLGLPRAVEAAAVEWLLSAGAPVNHLLVIREALKDLRESGVFNFQTVDAETSENSSIADLNKTIIRNMIAANTPPENALDESLAAPKPYSELNLFVSNLIAEVQSLSNPLESAAQRSDLVKRLWESDSASALTNEAAREIEKISTELEKAIKSSQTAWLQVEAAFLELKRHGFEVSTSVGIKQASEPKFEAVKNKGGVFDVFIDGKNIGVFDEIDGNMVYFPKRNEQITGDHYILIGRELNKINDLVSNL